MLKWSSRFLIFALFLFALASLGVIPVRADGEVPPPESAGQVGDIPEEETQPVESNEIEPAAEISAGGDQEANTQTPAAEEVASEPLVEEEVAEPVSEESIPPAPVTEAPPADVEAEQPVTLIQDALDTIPNSPSPEPRILYIGGGEHSEDIRIEFHENLVLQGADGQNPAILIGTIYIVNSSNIFLRDLLIEGVVLIQDSADISVGENIIVAGTVDSLQAELSGGDLLVSEGQSSQVDGSLWLNGENVTVNGDLAADGIYIQSSDTTYVSGELSAPGGTVQILGERVALIDDARVSVSSPNGGGTVLIGGDYQGQGTVPNAQQAYVGPDVVIQADAVDNGDGGYVIVWADETTQFYGTISAQGGPNGGNGGFVETSGKEFLEVIGASVSASAPLGQAGTWLMDPHDVEIMSAGTINGAFGGGNPNVFTPTADTAVVNVADIESSLNSGTSVTITTGSTGTQPGNITVTDAINKTAGGDATLTLEAANDIILNQSIQSSAGMLHVVLSADADKDQVGTVIVNIGLFTNDGNLTIQGADVSLGAAVVANAGAILVEPSVNSINCGIGIGAVGAFYVDDSELAFLTTTGVLTIGQSGGSGDVSIGTVNSLNLVNLVISGRNITFDGLLTVSNGKLQINAGGAIIGNNVAGLDIALDPGHYLVIDAVGAIGDSAKPIETQVYNFAAESDSGGIFVTNRFALTIDQFARLDGQTGASGTSIDGIIASGGVTLTAESPLTVNRAIRENAGGDINLTAGNNSSQLGDNLTINADVIITGSTGKITGNAGDNIIVSASVRVSAPEGVFFNSGLDGTADEDNGTTSISGILQAIKPGAIIIINSPNGITIHPTGQIVTNGGNVTLQAVNGTVTQNGTITLNGGLLTIIEKPPAPPIPVPLPPDVSSDTTNQVTTVATAVTSAILSVVNGQQVSLLETAALGSALTLQLPDGNGATFLTGVNAIVSMVSNTSLTLPAALPFGFIALSNLLIDILPQDETVELGEILVAFGSPAGLTENLLFILHWDEEDSLWAELPINETTAAQVTALSDNGGFFVLAKLAEESGESVQVELSGTTGQAAVLRVGRNQITISGAAGDLVTITPLGDPGNLPDGMRFLDGLQVEITLNDAQVSILPVGESLQIAFGLPEGTEDSVTILYWLPTLNSGQGGWTNLTAQPSTEGYLTLETFFGGTFILAAQ
jgi:hypothetical protein